MLTIKQLQAFCWVAKLNTLSKAAERLFITQSAVTKRLQEVEALAATPLFETGGRKDQVTAKGIELIAECEKLFSPLDELDLLKGSTQQPARTVHVGLTEVTALTWFPSFLKQMKRVYPSVTVQPEIDLSSLLRQKVQEGRLDFAFLPSPPISDGLVQLKLGAVPFGWFAAPDTFDPNIDHSLQELSAHTVIEQSANSIITELCTQLWGNAGVQPQRIYGGNNVYALAGLISAGVGASCLPLAIFEQEVQRGRLQLVRTKPVAPSVPYYCCFLGHLHAALGYGVVEISRRCFSLNSNKD